MEDQPQTDLEPSPSSVVTCNSGSMTGSCAYRELPFKKVHARKELDELHEASNRSLVSIRNQINEFRLNERDRHRSLEKEIDYQKNVLFTEVKYKHTQSKI